MSIDLKAMSLKELKKLQTSVEKALKTAEERGRRDALKAAEKVAAEFGFSLQELSPGAKVKKPKTAKKPAKAKARAKPKYRNPENAEQTWTGRGRRPQWFLDAIANNSDISDLEI
jgi:DNA-binding protein H-NS